MTISELIELGYEATKKCTNHSEYFGKYYSGQEFEDWLSIATRFVEITYPNDKDTIKFRELASNAENDSTGIFLKLIALLKAFDSIPPVPKTINIEKIIYDICKNFDKFARQLARRSPEKSTLLISHENDLQDAIHAILRLHVNDIRPEEFTPSHAGSNSRIDFLLPEHSLIVETKMTREKLKHKEVGEELLIDIARYQQRKDYNHLICLVYDKNQYIKNPHGLIKDLEKHGIDNFKVTVIISPV